MDFYVLRKSLNVISVPDDELLVKVNKYWKTEFPEGSAEEGDFKSIEDVPRYVWEEFLFEDDKLTAYKEEVIETDKEYNLCKNKDDACWRFENDRFDDPISCYPRD